MLIQLIIRDFTDLLFATLITLKSRRFTPCVITKNRIQTFLYDKTSVFCDKVNGASFIIKLFWPKGTILRLTTSVVSVLYKYMHINSHIINQLSNHYMKIKFVICNKYTLNMLKI